MIDSNETIMYQDGCDSGYSEGFDDATEMMKTKLEYLKSFVQENGQKMSESKLPHRYYKAISVKKVIEIIDEMIKEEM